MCSEDEKGPNRNLGRVLRVVKKRFLAKNTSSIDKHHIPVLQMAAGLSLNMWSVVISAIISGILQDSFPVTGMINGYILITNESLCPVGGKISSNLICKGFFFPTTTSYPIFHCSHYEDIARSNDFFLGGDQWRYWRLRLRKCLRH